MKKVLLLLAMMFSIPAFTQTCTAVFIGDSITANWPLNFPTCTAINKGISGNTTVDMLNRFQTDVISLHPTFVFILGGINDILTNVPAFTTEWDLIEMVKMANDNGIATVIGTVLPAPLDLSNLSPPKPGNYNPQIENLDAFIRSLQGIGITDYHLVMVGPDSLPIAGTTIDGVHPTTAGYNIMDGLVEKYLPK